MSVNRVYCGVDISKERLDLHIRPSGRKEGFAHTKAGLRRLAGVLGSEGVSLAVMEATGRLEDDVASALEASGVPVAVVNPARIRHFARAIGREAKTDAIDAEVIAHYAEAVQPSPRTPRTPSQEEAAALMDRRREVVAMITAERNRLRRARSQAVAALVRKHLQLLEKELESLEGMIGDAVSADPQLEATAALLDSAPGVGRVVAVTLAGELPELGRLTHREIASLAGLAPFSRDSGTLRGKRMVMGGRRAVRSALYMAAVSSVRTKTELAAFYRRLVEAGKPRKLALTATARKLLVMLNAIARRGTPWQPARP